VPPRDERTLLAAVVRGDRAAANELVERTYRDVWAALFKLTGGDADLAADLTQDTYRKAWTALPSFRGGARLSTWLYKIAYTTFLNHLRRPRRLTAIDEDQVAAVPDDGPLPDELIGSQVDAARLRRAMLELPDELRYTVTARYWGGQSAREIADQAGVTAVAIRKRLRRAYEVLAAALQEDAP
jgi:RNA polymerase sigma-70 factor (ECF subfamily)